jgi:general nucleoside transport system permease protein
MNRLSERWINLGFSLGAVLLALLFTTIVLILAGAPPLDAYRNILFGAFSSVRRFSDVLVAWVPLLLSSAGLLVTFRAGLWNIGIEGQITLGAIFSTGMLRMLLNVEISPWLALTLAILAGMVGGALWASLAGALKTFGGVNEIFGGLGLNFVATAITLWLIFGPWKRPGIGSMSGTEPFPMEFWLPTLTGLRLSIWSIVIAVVVVIIDLSASAGYLFWLTVEGGW